MWVRETAGKVPGRGVAFLAAILEWRAGKMGTDEFTDMFVQLVGGKK